MKNFTIAAAVVLLLLAAQVSALKQRKADYVRPTPVPMTVDKETITKEANVISKSSKHDRRVKPPTLVLGFIDNSRQTDLGYENAILFGEKFTHISPTWYSIVPKPDAEFLPYELLGEENYNKSWVRRLSRADVAGGPKLMPRFKMVLTSDESRELLANSEHAQEVANLISDLALNKKLKGIVLDWPTINYNDMATKGRLQFFFNKLRTQLKHKTVTIIFVLPIPATGLVSQQEYLWLEEMADLFVLPMHEDEQNLAKSVDLNVKALIPKAGGKKKISKRDKRKIFVGVNFFGTSFPSANPVQRSAIDGQQFLDVITQRDIQFKLNEEAMSHEGLYKNDDGEEWQVIYPTLPSLKDRLDRAVALSQNVAIWDLSGGLNYFMEML
jgi:hypothetical protein